MVTVLTKIERAPFGAPTPEEITHDQIAKQHFLKYCDGVKCIRGSAHSLKANWHNGFCTECAFNPYNMAAEAALEENGGTVMTAQTCFTDEITVDGFCGGGDGARGLNLP